MHVPIGADILSVEILAITLICEPAWIGDYSRLHMLQIH